METNNYLVGAGGANDSAFHDELHLYSTSDDEALAYLSPSSQSSISPPRTSETISDPSFAEVLNSQQSGFGGLCMERGSEGVTPKESGGKDLGGYQGGQLKVIRSNTVVTPCMCVLP